MTWRLNSLHRVSEFFGATSALVDTSTWLSWSPFFCATGHWQWCHQNSPGCRNGKHDGHGRYSQADWTIADRRFSIICPAPRSGTWWLCRNTALLRRRSIWRFCCFPSFWKTATTLGRSKRHCLSWRALQWEWVIGSYRTCILNYDSIMIALLFSRFTITCPTPCSRTWRLCRNTALLRRRSEWRFCCFLRFWRTATTLGWSKWHCLRWRALQWEWVIGSYPTLCWEIMR